MADNNTIAPAFPSDWQSPAEKAKLPYNLQFAKAAYAEYVSDNVLITANRRADFIRNRLYAEGNQPNDKYKKWSTFKDNDGTIKSYVDLDYTPVSPIPKYRDIVLSILEKQDYEIELSAIDPASDELRLKTKYDVWAKKLVNDILKAEALIVEATGQPEEILPQTKEELEIYMTTIKLAEEMAMKSILDLTFYANKWPEVCKLVYADLFDNGLAGVKEYVTKQGKHVIRYVDIVNLYVRKTRMRDCTGSNAIGEVIEMTISDLYAEAGTQFTPDQYKEIISKSAGLYNNPLAQFDDYVDTDSDDFLMYGIYGFVSKYGNFKIKIFDINWFTIDEQYYEAKKNPAGEEMLYRKEYGYSIENNEFYTEEENGKTKYYKKNSSGVIEMKKKAWDKESLEAKNKSDRSVKKAAPKMVYGCKWIVGTEYAYDYGLTNDMPREHTNLSETNLPYHIYRLSNKSHVERMIPFADGFMLSWMKLQNAKAKARPNGIMVELDALENMSINGQDFTPLQALAVYDATGNLIYKGTGMQGDATRHRPVEPLAGGLGTMWAELVGDMNMNIEMIRSVTGFNEILDATTPQKGQSVRGAELALNSANNAIYPLISSYLNIFERTAKSSSLRLQMMSKYNKLKGYEEAIGAAPRKVIEVTQDLSLLQMGIKIEAKPSEKMKEDIKLAALAAMNTRDETGMGQITYTDYLFIMRILEGGNLKYAEGVLAHRIEKRVAAKAQMAQQNIKMNGEEQRASAAQVAEAEAIAAQKKLESEIILINTQADADIRVDQHKYSKMKEISEMEVIGKVSASHAKNQADITKKVIESDTKLATHEPKEKVAQP